MASKWRMNVNDLGWWGGNFELIASTPSGLAFFDQWWARTKFSSPNAALLQRFFTVTDPPTVVGYATYPGNFPWGHVVEPD